MNSKNPLYVADYGEKSFFVLNRETKNIQKLTLDQFSSLEWCSEPGNIAGNIAIETAHIRVSFFENPETGERLKKSKAQPWADENQIKNFFKKCNEKGIELRGLPEKSIWGFRKIYYPNEKKGDEIDLKTWDEAMNDNPYIWEVAHKSNNMEFYDSKKTITPKDNKHTYYTAGKKYQDRLKIASCIISASGKWKESIPAKKAYSEECIDKVTRRLANHNSENGKIKDGVATFNYQGKTYNLSLLTDVMGFERNKKNNGWNKTKKPKQYISCMMLLLDSNGNRYNNVLTNKSVGFKMIKQYGMVSSAFHMKPGFLRPKF